MIEHWVEKYHQIGFRYNDKWRLMKDKARKATLRAHCEHIRGHPEVMKRLIVLKSRFTQGKNKKMAVKRGAIWEVKRERMDAALVASTLHEFAVVPAQDAASLMALNNTG